MQGREKMRAGWRGYFAHVPGLLGFARRIFQNGDTVAASGGGGTVRRQRAAPSAGTSGKTPAAWRAVVENGLIQEWRVYADNKPVYDILAKPSSKTPGSVRPARS